MNTYTVKGDATQCANDRPIWLLQVVYKIWPILQTRKIRKILYAIARNKQYGYNVGLPTVEAVVGIENYIEK